jgi:hypothetical protein
MILAAYKAWRLLFIGFGCLVTYNTIHYLNPLNFPPFILLQMVIMYEITRQCSSDDMNFIFYFYVYITYFDIIHLVLHPNVFLTYYTFLYFTFLSLITYTDNDNDTKELNKVSDYFDCCSVCEDLQMECSICLETRNLKRLPCNHSFHKECLLKWFETSSSRLNQLPTAEKFTCPICRRNIYIENDFC